MGSRLAIGYLRVSTTGQAEDGVSIDQQEAQVRAYCVLKGLADPEIIVDLGMSGTTDRRPGFQRLISLCKNGVVGTVIVFDLSRLSRSVRNTLAFIDDIVAKHGIAFVSLSQQIDTSTPHGRAFLQFISIFNELYVADLRYRTRKALEHKRSLMQKTGGTVPFGFDLSNEMTLTVNRAEIEGLLLIKELRDSGRSLREIAVELECRQIRTKTGKASWNIKVVRDILKRCQRDTVLIEASLADD